MDGAHSEARFLPDRDCPPCFRGRCRPTGTPTSTRGRAPERHRRRSSDAPAPLARRGGAGARHGVRERGQPPVFARRRTRRRNGGSLRTLAPERLGVVRQLLTGGVLAARVPALRLEWARSVRSRFLLQTVSPPDTPAAPAEVSLDSACARVSGAGPRHDRRGHFLRPCARVPRRAGWTRRPIAASGCLEAARLPARDASTRAA